MKQGWIQVENNGAKEELAPKTMADMVFVDQLQTQTVKGALETIDDNLPTATNPAAINRGGTGATTVAGARNALGLGNTSGALPVANGGTGQTASGMAFYGTAYHNVQVNVDIAYTAGFYITTNDSTGTWHSDLANASSRYGILFVLNTAGNVNTTGYTVQIWIGMNVPNIYLRTRADASAWGAWKKATTA